MYINYPKTIKYNQYCFKLNTDDYHDPKPIDEFLKSKGVTFKRTKQYSKTKCMGWHIYKIPTNDKIKSFEENIDYSVQLLKGLSTN